MSGDEKHWIEEAVDQCAKGTRAGALILIVRRQDANGECDMVITNATDAQVISALVKAVEPTEPEE